MTTWTLKTTPASGAVTVKTGLTEQEMRVALAELMYGTFDDDAPAHDHVEHEERIPVAA